MVPQGAGTGLDRLPAVRLRGPARRRRIPSVQAPAYAGVAAPWHARTCRGQESPSSWLEQLLPPPEASSENDDRVLALGQEMPVDEAETLEKIAVAGGCGAEGSRAAVASTHVGASVSAIRPASSWSWPRT